MTSTTANFAQMTGLNGYTVNPVFTVGETINGYTPPGILDGGGAYSLDEDTVRYVVNHELGEDDGYLYTLNPGTADELQITGTRISFFDIDKTTFAVEDAGIAYERVFGVDGSLVTSTDQIPNSDGGTDGFGRFCSGQFFQAGTYGLVDDVYLSGEEIDDGLGVVLDTQGRDLYLAPYLGRGGWENAALVDTGNENFTGLLWTDDSEGSLIYLWVGEKDTSANAGFLDRNGLGEEGILYAWVPDSGDIDGQGFTTTGPGEVDLTGNVDIRDRIANDSYGNGSWKALTVKDETKAGSVGYDEYGFALENTLRQEAYDLGALAWSRPEDIDTNPNNPTQFAIANTGRDTFAPIPTVDLDGDGIADEVSFDYVGDVMIGNIDFSALSGLSSISDVANGSITTQFTLAYDGDQDPNRTLRSPDNLDWAQDGFIYVQEDRAVGGLWGKAADQGPDRITGGEVINQSESQIVRIDPNNGNPADGGALPVAVINRNAVLPTGQIDTDPDDVGDWESSGIEDVSNLFGAAPGSVFIYGTQAHSVSGGLIGDPTVPASDPTSDDANLVEGGQIAFLVKATEGTSSDDTLVGLNLSQVMAGLGGSDIVRGGTGDDILRGDDNSRSAGGVEGGNDTIFGGAGNDRIGGKGGNDILFGDAGDDQIFGDAGDDLLFGGAGNDRLQGDANTGAKGVDTFVLAAGEDVDTIVDFEAGKDLIGLIGTFSFGQLTIIQTGADSLVSAGDDMLAKVLNTQVSALNESAFIAVTV